MFEKALVMYYLMLVRSALRDLCHEGCGRVADTARGETSAVSHHETTTRVP